MAAQTVQSLQQALANAEQNWNQKMGELTAKFDSIEQAWLAQETKFSTINDAWAGQVAKIAAIEDEKGKTRAEVIKVSDQILKSVNSQLKKQRWCET